MSPKPPSAGRRRGAAKVLHGDTRALGHNRLEPKLATSVESGVRGHQVLVPRMWGLIRRTIARCLRRAVVKRVNP